MQNLRDKLLKAGLVNKKQKRQAEHNERQRRRKRKKKGGGEAEPDAEARRQEIYQAQLDEQRERNQAIAQQQRAEREAKERDLRVRHLVDYYAQSIRRARQRWYFVTREQKIQYLMVDDAAAYALERGHGAIVERPRAPEDEPQHVVVDRQAADLIWSIADAYVRFYNRQDEARPARAWETGPGELETPQVP